MIETVLKLPTAHESEFANIHIDAINSVLYHFYKGDSTEKMMDDDYKAELEQVLKASLKYEVKSMVADTRNFQFAITPELQDWTDEEIFAKHLYLKKCAVIVSEDLIGQLSLEQVTEENSNDKFIFQFFDNLERADQWAKQMR